LCSCSLQSRLVYEERKRETNALVDIMLRTTLNTGLLQTKNSLVRSFTSKERICTESFPIPSSLSYTTHIHHRPQSNINTFSNMLLTHQLSSQPNQLAVPGTSSMYTRRERTDKVCKPNTKGRILQT